MAKSEEKEEDFDGIKWEEELEDDTLATVQRKLENEFNADFENSDFDKKGFSSDAIPFYTGLSETFEFWNDRETEEIDLSIQREGEMNTVEYWADDGAVMESFQDYLTEHSKSSKGQMLEPYKIKRVSDVEVLRLLGSMEQRFDMEGPERNPGNGETRIYPVMLENLDNEDSTPTVPDGEVTIEEEDESDYAGQVYFLPGDAKFQLEGETPESFEVDGEISIRPQKRERGLYKIEINAEDRQSMLYLAQYADNHLRTEEDE